MMAYAEGDVAAFDDLVRRYGPTLLRFLGKGMARADVAEDLVQQTFLQLHRNRYDFRTDAKLRPWLFTIALNVKRQHLRAERRRQESWMDPNLEWASDVGDRGGDLAHEVRVAWGQLPADQREVIRLHFVEGRTFPEVARAGGASANAVKLRAHRGYVQLRAIFRAST